MTIQFRAISTMPSSAPRNRQPVLLKFADGCILVAGWAIHIENYDWCPLYSGESATHHHGQPVEWCSLSAGNDVLNAEELETMQNYPELEGEIERLRIQLADRIVDINDSEH